MADSNTARSKRWLEKQGWSCWNVEQTIQVPPKFPGDKATMFKRDVYNFGDCIGFKPIYFLRTAPGIRSFAEGQNGGVMLIQTTTVANQAARVAKIKGIPEAEGWLKSGGRIQVHGWRQKGGKGGRWLLTIQELEIDEDFPGTLKSEEKSTANAPLFEGE